jgi:hypothetical protein
MKLAPSGILALLPYILPILHVFCFDPFRLGSLNQVLSQPVCLMLKSPRRRIGRLIIILINRRISNYGY